MYHISFHKGPAPLFFWDNHQNHYRNFKKYRYLSPSQIHKKTKQKNPPRSWGGADIRTLKRFPQVIMIILHWYIYQNYKCKYTDPAIPLLGTYRYYVQVQNDIGTKLFIAALYIIAKKWNRDWLNKLWYSIKCNTM